MKVVYCCTGSASDRLASGVLGAAAEGGSLHHPNVRTHGHLLAQRRGSAPSCRKQSLRHAPRTNQSARQRHSLANHGRESSAPCRCVPPATGRADERPQGPAPSGAVPPGRGQQERATDGESGRHSTPLGSVEAAEQ